MLFFKKTSRSRTRWAFLTLAAALMLLCSVAVPASASQWQDKSGNALGGVVTSASRVTSEDQVTAKAPAQLTLTTSATVVDWGAAASLTGELTDGSEPFTSGQQIRLEWSYDGSTWTLLQMLDPSAPYAYGVAVTPVQKTYYRLVFEGDAAHTAATSLIVTVTPRVKLGVPSAPRSVKKGRRFTAYGSIVPQQEAGTKTVRIRCYRKSSGKWRLKKTVTATNADYKTFSRYSVRFALTSRGSWKLVAFSAATSMFAGTTSGERYVKVR